jgi:hypothetical protein
MIGYVITTWSFAAFSTFQVVGGIEGLASWTGVFFSNLLEPLFIPNRLDSFKIGPKLYPMRHPRLKQFQVIAGILFTFAAKVDTSLCCTGGHFAFPTVGQPFSGPTSITLALLH